MISIPESTGKLYIVATPIGNLGDISQRAIEILQQVDLIAAEDTRHSAYLMTHLGIKTPLISFHDHNEREKCELLIQKLQNQVNIALISDAGTPLISDPGYILVRQARKLGITVIPIPGCCAAIAAISASGLSCDRFVFEGFLPVKSAARVQKLTQLKVETGTLILYESKHRIVATVTDMAATFGEDRVIVICRELTKRFETINSGSAKALLDWLKAHPEQQKGEFIILIEGNRDKVVADKNEMTRTLEILLQELSVKQAVKLTVQLTGGKKRDIYEQALMLSGHKG